MKNLFKFATKELSQDAFLCWFLENFDDPKIGQFSRQFIKDILKINEEVCEIKTEQQVNKIDITAKVCVGNNKNIDQPDYLVIIEDKTTSSAHTSQLTTYAKVVEKRKTESNNPKLRRIFYKVDLSSEDDKKEIEEANKYLRVDVKSPEDELWKAYYIDEIYSFFSKLGSTDSEILYGYIEHISGIYKDLVETPESLFNQWNFNNMKCFMREEIYEKYIKPKYRDSIYFFTSCYQGRFFSAYFYYRTSNKKISGNNNFWESKALPLIELKIYEGSNKVTIYSHMWFCLNEQNKGTWKPSEANQEYSFDLVDRLKIKLQKEQNIKIHPMNGKSSQTISTENMIINDSSIDTSSLIAERVEKYLNIFKEVFDNY